MLYQIILKKWPHEIVVTVQGEGKETEKVIVLLKKYAKREGMEVI